MKEASGSPRQSAAPFERTGHAARLSTRGAAQHLFNFSQNSLREAMDFWLHGFGLRNPHVDSLDLQAAGLATLHMTAELGCKALGRAE